VLPPLEVGLLEPMPLELGTLELAPLLPLGPPLAGLIAALLALALAALVVPFWLFAQAAAPTLGLLAFLIALLAYGMCAAALVAASAVLTGRVVLERFRRALTLR